MTQLTLEQVEQLSPDDASFKRARGLAFETHWASLGGSESALWGECKGSGKKPYRTQIDLTDFATKCSCPSRKFPCKHALGLMLIAVDRAGHFKESRPPDWAAEWLAARRKRQEKQAQKDAAPADDGGAGDAAREKAAQRRVDKREALAREGIDSLSRWLKDTAHLGLAALETVPASFWEDQAARMVDCQIPGAARMIREMASLPGERPDWPDHLLLHLGRLHLLAQAYRKLEGLPEAAQADVRSLLGWTTYQNEVLESEPAVVDDWLVLASYTEDFKEAHLRAYYNWLWGRQTKRTALLLTFARQHINLIFGRVYHGALHFYPGAVPLRAVDGQKKMVEGDFIPSGTPSLDSFLTEYAEALGRNPWVETFPAVLDDVVPLQTDGGWALRDAAGTALPLAPGFLAGWPLAALSGGRPIKVFALWDGFGLMPISVWAEGRFVQL